MLVFAQGGALVRLKFLAIAGSMVFTVVSVPKAIAQIPFLPHLQAPSSLNNDSDNRIVSGWIYLDGRPLFQVAASKTNFPERLQNIQQNLHEITQNFLRSSEQLVKVEARTVNELPVIYVNNRYLMTITPEDARLRQGSVLTSANQITNVLPADLQRAKQERQTQFLVQQGTIASASILAMMLLSWGVRRWQQRLKDNVVQPIPPTSTTAKQITKQLNQVSVKN